MGLLYAAQATVDVRARQEAVLYQRMGCNMCPLNDVQPGRANATGSEHPLILFIGEAPGKEEQRTGEQFVGESGQLLRPRIPEEWLPDIRWTNTVHCRPSYGNGHNRTPEHDEIECCRPRWVADIERTKPKAIFAFGNVPLLAITNFTGITLWRGRRLPVRIGSHVCWLYPMLHPAHILRQRRDEDRGKDARFVGSEEERMFEFDLYKALDEVDAGLPRPIVHDEKEARRGVEIVTEGGREGLHRIEAALRWASAQDDIGFDYETLGLRPYGANAKILTVAVATADRAIAFPIHHREARFSDKERKTIEDLVCNFLCQSGRVWVHNLSFEMEWTAVKFGRDLLYATQWQDTATQASIIDERKGNTKPGCFSLEWLVMQYFGFNLKKLSPLNKANLDREPLPKVLAYNAMDAKYHLRLGLEQQVVIKQQGLQSVYELSLRRVPAVVTSQVLGVPVDQDENERLHAKYAKRVASLEAEIQQVPLIQGYNSDNAEPFNPGSNPQCVDVFYRRLKRKECLVVDKFSKRERLSCNEDVLTKIEHPLSKLIVRWRKAKRQDSTYIQALAPGTENSALWPDGLLHSTFNTYWVETGRLSCSAPWTEVKTSRGVVQIKDVIAGDLVWTHRQRWRLVTRAWSKGFEQMFDVVLSNGKVLTCTKNHRLLSKASGWITVGELYDVFQEMGRDAGEYKARTGALSQQGVGSNRADSQDVGHIGTKRLRGYQTEHAIGREAGSIICSLFGIEAGHKKSDAGANWRSASELEGGMFGWSWWLFDHKGWKASYFSPPPLAYAGIGSTRSPTRLDGTPYRWRPVEQRRGQFGFGDGSRTQSYPLQTVGDQDVAIKEIKAGGSFEVFDLTVEEDASYETCGVFSHNSEFPNLQNFPKRDGEAVEVRRQVQAAPGYSIISLDLGQIEARVVAMFTKDPVYVKQLWDKFDIHKDWAERIAFAYPDRIGGSKNLKDPKVMKTFRSDIKNQWTFPLLYGASCKSVAGSLSIPEDKLTPLYDQFWSEFSTVKKWQEDQLRFYRRHGYVECLTGRRRHGPLSLNKVYNTPVQGTAAEIIMDRMCYMVESGDPELLPELQIHDDLTFLRVREERAEEVAGKILDIMLDLRHFPWVNVPISVEVATGFNWMPWDKDNNPEGLRAMPESYFSNEWLKARGIT